MAITRLNSLAIPAGTVEPADISYPLTNFSSTGIDDNATSTAITIDSSENVGIGTASPDTALEISVAGSGATDVLKLTTTSTNSIPAILFEGDGFGTQHNIARIRAQVDDASNGGLIFETENSGTIAERMRIDSSGNVGIGTSSPNASSKINVLGDASSYGILVEQPSGYGGFNIKSTTVNQTWSFLAQDNASNSDLHLYGGSLAGIKMTINHGGNVGIGTTSPSTKLHLGGTAPLDSIIRQDSTVSGTNWEIGERAAGKWQIWEDDSDSVVATFTSSGLVGIGTTSPVGPLSVVAASGGGAIDVFGRSADGLGWLSFKTNNGSSSHSLIGTPIADTLAFYTNGFNERMRITSAGDVGIGTTSPNGQFEVADSVYPDEINITINNMANSSNGALRFFRGTQEKAAIRTISEGAYARKGLSFYTNNTGDYTTDAVERMRISASGHLIVGKTDTSFNNVGITAYNNGQFQSTVSSNECTAFQRLVSQGDISQYYYAGTYVGSIAVLSSLLAINATGPYNTGALAIGGSIYFQWDSNQFYPLLDNARDLGTSSYRWDDVYATNGTIQTSDANEKQDVEALSEAETRVAVAAKGLLRKFRWKSAVEEKGDDARIHFGIIAQDLQAAFEAEGLDAGDYAMFIHSTWTDEETGEERSRMGVRYSELLAFIIAALKGA